MGLVTLLAPIILELLKIFFGGGNATEKEKAQKEILEYLAKIRVAIQKAEDSGGDTSEIEDVINRK